MMNNLVKIGLTGLLLVAACRKSTHDAWPTASAFVGKAWRLEAIRPLAPTDLNGDGQAEANILPLLDACERDDRLTFAANGHFHSDRGAARCSPNEAPEAPGGTYRFLAKTRTILLSDWSAPGTSREWTVIETSGDHLRVRTVFDLPDRSPLTAELIFTTN
jgi:hypothetical protein